MQSVMSELLINYNIIRDVMVFDTSFHNHTILYMYGMHQGQKETIVDLKYYD